MVSGAGIPVVIGSAGGSGGRVHVEWTWSIIREILQENGYEDKKVAVVWGDIPKEVVAQRLAEGKVTPLGMAVPELTAERLERTPLWWLRWVMSLSSRRWGPALTSFSAAVPTIPPPSPLWPLSMASIWPTAIMPERSWSAPLCAPSRHHQGLYAGYYPGGRLCGHSPLQRAPLHLHFRSGLHLL